MIAFIHSLFPESRLILLISSGIISTSWGMESEKTQERPDAIASINTIPNPSEKDVSIKISKAIKIDETSLLEPRNNTLSSMPRAFAVFSSVYLKGPSPTITSLPFSLVFK